MVCSDCGTANEPGRKFCAECGQRLDVACSACGASNTATAKFCGECGSALGTATPLTTAAQTEAPAARESERTDPSPTERRWVTVLFVDLVGSTPLAEARDPEDVRTMLGEYF